MAPEVRGPAVFTMFTSIGSCKVSGTSGEFGRILIPHTREALTVSAETFKREDPEQCRE